MQSKNVKVNMLIIAILVVTLIGLVSLIAKYKLNQSTEGKESPQFKLETVVSKVTVVKKGSSIDKVYNDKRSVKVNLEDRNIEDVIIKIEYAIIVTNMGNTSGYVREITNYLPEGTNIIQTESSQWVVKSDNIVTSQVLSKVLIPPANSVQVILTLELDLEKIENDKIINKAKITKVQNKTDIGEEFEFVPEYPDSDLEQAEIKLVYYKLTLLYIILVFLLMFVGTVALIIKKRNMLNIEDK